MPLIAWQEFHADKAFASIYFRGDGKIPITVNSVTVTGCKNMREVCGEYPVELRVQPGQVVEALQLHRLDTEKNWSFAFSFEAGKHKIPPEDAVPDPTRAPVPVNQIDLVRDGMLTGGMCQAIRNYSLPAKHRVLRIWFTAGNSPDFPARTVTAWYDAKGTAYRYEDRRGYGDVTLVTPHLIGMQQNLMHSPLPEVLIRLDVAGDSGTVATSWEDSTKVTRIVGPGLLTSEALGRPGDLIAKLWKECR